MVKSAVIAGGKNSSKPMLKNDCRRADVLGRAPCTYNNAKLDRLSA